MRACLLATNGPSYDILFHAETGKVEMPIGCLYTLTTSPNRTGRHNNTPSYYCGRNTRRTCTAFPVEIMMNTIF